MNHRHVLTSSPNYRRVRFKNAAGRFVFVTIWRDVFGVIRTVKNVAIVPGELTWQERKFQAVRNVAVSA